MNTATPLTNTGEAYGTRGYRNFVLGSLTLVYTLNFIDRILIGVVAQPIIEEFKLQDWQFGLLSGFGFALMYTLMGIPIARWAERYNRVRIIAFSVVLWSLMTAPLMPAGWKTDSAINSPNRWPLTSSTISAISSYAGLLY